MRARFQALIAVAVVSGAAATALTGPTTLPLVNSSISFSGIPIANLTHAWNVKGVGSSRTTWAIEYGGGGYFDHPRSGQTPGYGYFSGYAHGYRTYPPVGTSEMRPIASMWYYVPRRRATATTFTGSGSNTSLARPPYNDTEWLHSVNEAARYFVNGESTMQPPPGFKPIGGNLTLSSATTTANLRLVRNRSAANVDAVVRYRARVERPMGSPDPVPNEGRTVTGSIILKVRNAPRGMDSR